MHDSVLFDRTFTNLLELADGINLDIFNSSVVLDTGFDSQFNQSVIEYANCTPVIKPNIGARKDREKIYQILDAFEEVKHIYKGRFVIERTFAWEDTYRKLTTRYEKLNATFNGFRHLAYSMINYRWVFGKK